MDIGERQLGHASEDGETKEKVRSSFRDDGPIRSLSQPAHSGELAAASPTTPLASPTSLVASFQNLAASSRTTFFARWKPAPFLCVGPRHAASDRASLVKLCPLRMLHLPETWETKAQMYFGYSRL